MRVSPLLPLSVLRSSDPARHAVGDAGKDATCGVNFIISFYIMILFAKRGFDKNRCFYPGYCFRVSKTQFGVLISGWKNHLFVFRRKSRPLVGSPVLFH